MKVIYFVESLEENQDGVTRVVYKLNEFNEKKNINTLYITSKPSETKSFDFYKTKSLPIPGYEGYRMSISRWIEISKVVKSFNPDLLHIHAPFALGTTATKIAKNLNIPIISTYHTHFITYLKYHNAQVLEPILEAHLKSVYNKCNLNLIPSQNVLDQLNEMGIENLEVLPHGVDSTIFNTNFYNKEIREKYITNENKKTVFLYVGRLVWEKNLRLMAEVFNKLYETRDDFEFLIVGSGPAETELKELLPKAQYLGFKTGRELSEIYASCDSFVFPSDTETFGNVTVEAMSSGLVPIVANGGGSADIVTHLFNGLKFKADSFDDFFMNLVLSLDSKNLHSQLKNNAIESAKDYNWANIHSKMIDSYEEVIFQNLIKKNRMGIYPNRKAYFYSNLISR